MIDYNPFSLTGKTILITGASSGIGKATAIECSKMGARLIVTGRNEFRLHETFGQLVGDGHAQIVADLTRSDDIERLVDGCPELNGIVLCAGKGIMLPIQFCNEEKFADVFKTNFFSPVELLRRLMKKKVIAKCASVVFVSSIGGVHVFATGNAVYGASKAAINSVMRYFANELSARKIRVNSVNPGRVNTKLIQDGTMSEDQIKADIAKYPLRRYGEPEEIAHGIIYLLSDAASWVTGHSLVIDGGASI